MSYYDNQQEYDARGIDHDLGACLEYNPQGAFDLNDIERVLAVWEGENDGDDWRWVLLLKDGRHVFLQGGCDYTGWDCQSWASHAFADSAETAAGKALGNVPVSEQQHPANAGIGHMLNLMAGDYNAKNVDVLESLLTQLVDGKAQTWRELKDDEFGIE